VPIEDPINNAENMIEWSSDYRLKWEDFQGESRTDQRKAESFLALRRDITDTEIFEEGEKFYFKFTNLKVRNFFKKNESWVLPDQLTMDNHEIILKHEQGHFDINEIFARKYQAKLDESMKKQWECKGNTNDKRKAFSLKKGKRILLKIEKKIGKDSKNFQLKYDEETNFGLIIKKQFEYLRWISKEINP